jgi:hypothetical protein
LPPHIDGAKAKRPCLQLELWGQLS